MSTPTTNTNNNNTFNTIAVVDDVNMFEAARRGGRRNAFGVGDLEQQFHQTNAVITSAAIDQMMPDFQSMSLKP